MRDLKKSDENSNLIYQNNINKSCKKIVVFFSIFVVYKKNHLIIYNYQFYSIKKTN